MSEPYLKGLNKKYNKKDFSFISLYDEKEKKGLLKYANDKELNYDVLLVDKQIQEAYKLNMLPTFLILDKDKIIKKIIYGFGKGKTDIEIEKAIEELL